MGRIEQKGESLDLNIFRNPPVQYRGIPFWSWNCRITKEKIDRQLEIFAQMGFGGVDIHPRSGLDVEYLGSEYMELIEYTVKRCKEKGLLCWLYDEDRFPSGSAGGLVTKDWRFRGRFLLLTKKAGNEGVLPGYCENKEEFLATVERGEKPKGYYVTAYRMELEDGYLKSYCRIDSLQEALAAASQKENVRFAYVKLMEEEQWFEDQAYVDTMNPDAIARFIELTHEAYFAHVGEEFGKTVPAVFTDEPRLGKHGQLTWAQSDEDVSLPFTDYLAEKMLEKYGVDPLDIAPEYIWDLPRGAYSVNRYRYRDMTCECFAECFMDQIADWCNAHDIMMTGHVLSEDSLSGQSVTVGECMRCYRKMDLPGFDVLCDFREFIAAKQAASVARQNGKPGTVSELYGVTHWDCDFAAYKLQGDWQAALGVVVRVPHLSHMSMKGEAKRDWPGSIFYQSPWYEEFHQVEDHFARLNTALTRGKAAAKVAVVHPVESMWLHFGPEDQTGAKRRKMDRDFKNLTEWLLYGLMDFDYLSEALLPKQCPLKGQQEKTLQVGSMTYEAVVLPDMTTIRSTTLEILERFCDRGGKVIFMGRVPELVDGLASDRAKRLAIRCIRIPKEQNELLRALESERLLEIRCKDGHRSDNLFYQFRQEADAGWLFFCHVNRKKNQISVPEHYVMKVKGLYQVERYDTLTGRVERMTAAYENGWTVMELGMYAEDSLLFRLTRCRQEEGGLPQKSAAAGVGAQPGTRGQAGAGAHCGIMEQPGQTGLSCRKYKTAAYLQEPEDFCMSEPNAFLLDYAEYQLDDGPVQPREEILRADNQIRKKLGFVLRRERMNQPWHMQEKETHRVTLYYHFYSEIETAASLAIEDIEHSRVSLNGKPADMLPVGHYVDWDIPVISLPKLKRGENRLVVEVDYNQKSGLENLYVLGNFDVELSGSSARIREARKCLKIGDIIGQGMPFYTGNLDYVFRFCADEERDYAVHVPQLRAPALAVYVDGEKKGLIAYAPHRLELGKLKVGEHELKIRLFGNRFNGFGTLHNANENFTWYGPDSYRTRGDDWTDCYQLRTVGILGAVELEWACTADEVCKLFFD